MFVQPFCSAIAVSLTERERKKIELSPIWTDEQKRRNHGNRERNFFYVSCGIFFTEFLQIKVILAYSWNGDTDTDSLGILR